MKVQQQNFKFFDNNSDSDLSEEFLTMILKQVDVLCYIINNGDPNIQRTVKVIQVLNNAINCYKNKVNQEDIIENKDYFDNYEDLSGSENESNEYADKDTDYVPQKELLKRKPIKKKTTDNTKVSMTSLFAHKVAQPTKRRFLPKNLSQLVIFVIGLAFTWV